MFVCPCIRVLYEVEVGMKKFSFSYFSGCFLAVLFSFLQSACVFFGSNGPDVAKSSSEQQSKYYRDVMSQTGGLAFRTRNYLRSNLFDEYLKTDPQQLLYIMEDLYEADRSKVHLLAMMADICYYVASEMNDEDRALPFYLSSTLYAYRWLFMEEKKQHDWESESIHGRFGLFNCQQLLRYTMSSAKVFEYLQKRNLVRKDSYELVTATGQHVKFAPVLTELPFDFDNYTRMVPCAEYTITDISMVNRRFGIGIPVVMLLKDGVYTDKTLRISGNLPMPATVVLNFDSLDKERATARFQVYDTFITEWVNIHGTAVPLALDYTTPISVFPKFLPEESENLLVEVFEPSRMTERTGLYLLEPYNPDKIPVVFIHGLMSSPSTWMSMVNSLRNDYNIRRNFQFWFFKYSSGNPVFYSVGALRRALNRAQKKYATTPEAKNSFSRMVIVGHSMGGLISRTLLQDDPYYLVEKLTNTTWNEFSGKIKEEDRPLISDFICEKPPFVSRLVLMAVPHRGSKYAALGLTRYLNRFVSIPANVISSTGDLLKLLFTDEELDNRKKMEMLKMTGIENLDPDSPFIQALSSSQFASGIPVHSIIGNKVAAGVPGGSDGVVDYESAHIDGVVSELIVKSDHRVQRSAAGMRELQRILLQHLDSAKETGFIPQTIENASDLKTQPMKKKPIRKGSDPQ